MDKPKTHWQHVEPYETDPEGKTASQRTAARVKAYLDSATEPKTTTQICDALELHRQLFHISKPHLQAYKYTHRLWLSPNLRAVHSCSSADVAYVRK